MFRRKAIPETLNNKNFEEISQFIKEAITCLHNLYLVITGYRQSFVNKQNSFPRARGPELHLFKLRLCHSWSTVQIHPTLSLFKPVYLARREISCLPCSKSTFLFCQSSKAFSTVTCLLCHLGILRVEGEHPSSQLGRFRIINTFGILTKFQVGLTHSWHSYDPTVTCHTRRWIQFTVSNEACRLYRHNTYHIFCLIGGRA